MVKELEKNGISTAMVANMTPVAKANGATRIVKGVAIPHPFGNPELSAEKQYELRYKLTEKALNILTDEISEQTIYD